MRATERVATLEGLSSCVRCVEVEDRTYIPPMVNSPMNPTLVFAPILNPFKNGMGKSKTKRSSTMLVAACVAQLAKNTFGSLLPQATHLPSSEKFQFFSIGLQEKRASIRKTKPQQAVTPIMDQDAIRAKRFCMSKRRKY
jgi:hypothetical protein